MNAQRDELLTDEFIVLTGRPPLGRFVRFIRTKGMDGLHASEAELAKDWREGRETVRELERSERGWADGQKLLPLPDEMQPLAERGMNQPSIRRLRHYAPRQWWLVEIDRLVVFQQHMNLRFVEEIKAELPRVPTAGDIIRTAVGNVEQRRPAVRAIQGEDGTYTFSSASNDLRFLDVVNLDPASIRDYQPSGCASNALVIFVGFSDNLISAVQAGNRVILTNGSHRVYALRALGVTHVPCVVTQASRDDEYEFMLPADVKQDRAQYLTAPRPPVFKDYFDARIFKRIQVARLSHVLEARLTLEKSGFPAI